MSQFSGHSSDQTLRSPTTDSLPVSAESYENSQLDGSNVPPELDADIANIHARNSELRERKVTQPCFEVFDALESLENEDFRDWIGWISHDWCNEAIPLFEHDDADYQLHFSYTWTKGIRTYADDDEPEPGLSDLELHGIAGVTEEGRIEIITRPLVVISLGRLFVNQSGRSIWTGYELFVSGSLEVWMVYVPNQHYATSWKTIDTGLFAYRKESDQTGKYKLARFCSSLRDLRKATFEVVQKEVASTGLSRYTSFYRLELPGPDIQEFEGRDLEQNHSFCLRSENTTLGPGLACSQLLLLATEHTDECFVRLSSTGYGSYYEHGTSLLKEAASAESWQIVDMILASANVDAYAREVDFSDIDILRRADRSGSEALVKLILARIQPNLVDESGETPFITAILSGKTSLVKSLLETGKVDMDQPDVWGRKPLVVARERVNQLKSLERMKEEKARASRSGELHLDQGDSRMRLDNLSGIVRMLEDYSEEVSSKKAPEAGIW
ncbi:hypothetical protein F5B18DRAFT_611936 [Nemania serpens]|nr:hypothetical protein F5B18DRAFT_611936 [Nemania serpens]